MPTIGSEIKRKCKVCCKVFVAKTLDSQACIYADNVRKLRQHERDSAILYTDKENEIAAQNERGEQDIIKYFNGIISKRHPNSSNSVIVNWMRVGELLKIYSQGNPIPFKSILVKLLEGIKMFLLRAPMGGNRKAQSRKIRLQPISLSSRPD